MSFDEQLRRAFDTLNDHLRDELAQQVAALSDELRTTAAAERERALAALRADQNDALEAAARERDEALTAAAREHEESLEAVVRERDAAIATARERDEALAAAAREHEASLAAVLRERDAAIATARERDEASAAASREHEETIAAVARERDDALRERDEALAAAARERDAAVTAAQAHAEALDAARSEAAAAAGEQVRNEAERDVAARLATATAAAEAHGRQQAEADAQQRLDELQLQLRDAEQRAHAAQEESRQALEQAAATARAGSHAAAATPLERLLDGVRAIDHARSLSEILDTLVGCAGREAARAGVLLVRDRELRGWRFVGFDGQIERDAEVGIDEAGIVGDAVHRAQVCHADGPAAVAPRFASLPAGCGAVAVPLALAGQVVAVLYADQTEDGAGGGHWVEAIELLARHATSALEAVTAFKTARALVQNPDARGGAPNGPSDDHEAARRYARLLVSEIKLYHEADVLAGRRERDLANRLAGEIERARTLYYERVPLSIRAGHDYFHAELVRTLASGDPSLLGELKA